MRKRKGKKLPGYAAGVVLWGTALCLLWQTPAQAAKSPLISGTETAKAAEGPAVEGGSEEPEEETASAGISEEALNDNLIEYEELEALVRSGNSSVKNQQNSYQNSLEIYQSAYDSLISGRRDMLNKADELEDEGGDSSLISSYDQNASILSSSAKQMKRSITSLNSASSQLSREKTVWSFVKAAESLMGSCKEMEGQLLTAGKRAETRQAEYDKTSSMRTAGLATEEELLQAEENLLEAQIAMQSAQDSLDRLKRQLALMIGRNASDIELGSIPAVTWEELESLELEKDKANAIIADSSVKSVKRSSVTGDTARRLRRQQLEEAEGTVSLTVDEQYQELAALYLERDASAAAFAAAEKDYGALQIKYSSGLISKSVYLAGETEYYQKKAEKEMAETELRIGLDAYKWMIKGVN